MRKLPPCWRLKHLLRKKRINMPQSGYGLYSNIFGHLLEFLRFVFWMLEITRRIRLERKDHRFPKEPMIYLPSTDGFKRSACPPYGRVLVDRANHYCEFKQITKNTRDWGWKASSVWIRNRISTVIDSERAKVISALPHLRLGRITILLGPRIGIRNMDIFLVLFCLI
jgi:hypothetical protein